MIVSTTHSLEGKHIIEYKGIVTGEVILGANMFKDFMAGIRDLIGGRASTYEKVLREAKEKAIEEIINEARILGANAIVGLDIDFETIGARGSMLMVAVSGTAVVVS